MSVWVHISFALSNGKNWPKVDIPFKSASWIYNVDPLQCNNYNCKTLLTLCQISFSYLSKILEILMFLIATRFLSSWYYSIEINPKSQKSAIVCKVESRNTVGEKAFENGHLRGVGMLSSDGCRPAAVVVRRRCRFRHQDARKGQEPCRCTSVTCTSRNKSRRNSVQRAQAWKSSVNIRTEI